MNTDPSENNHLPVFFITVVITQRVILVWFLFSYFSFFTDPPEPLPTEPDEIERHEYVNVYINACKSLGLTPATFIVHNLMEPSLIMRSRSVGPKAAKAIFIALAVSFD